MSNHRTRASDRVRRSLGQGAGLSLVVPQAFPRAAEEEISEIVRRARERHGFAAFEFVPPQLAENVSRLRETLREGASRAVLLAGLPLLRARGTLSGSDEQRAVAITTVKAIVRQAAELNAEAVMVTSGPRVQSVSEATQISAFVDSLAQLAEFARREAPQVRIRIEPTDTDVQHRQFVGGTALAVRIVRDVADAGETVDLNLDLSHLIQLGEDPSASLQLAADDCRHVHMANCVLEPGHELYGDKHPPFGTPGSAVDIHRLAGTFAELRRIGYLDKTAPSLIGVEVIPSGSADPWETLDRAVDDLATALDTEAVGQADPPSADGSRRLSS